MKKSYPEWMTDEAIYTIKKGYLAPGENLYDAWNRIANSSAKYLAMEGMDQSFCEKFKKDLLWVLEKGYLGLASPVFSELGRDNGGLPISCFSVSVDDSISGIFESISETAKMTQCKGGVGTFLGNIRHSGSPISTGGNSTGVLPFAKLFDSTAKTVAQGSMRRGSFALYLPIEHPDIHDFLLSKEHTSGDSRRWIDSNIAVTITDEWMKQMLGGDEEKRDLFIQVLLTRLKSGSPYIIYIDNINKTNPLSYIQNNLKVETSNLCFTGDTLVAVADGRNTVPISELVGTKFQVYSARKQKYKNKWKTEIKNAIAFKTGTREIIEVFLEDGTSFKCTPDHLLAKTNTNWVKAKDSLNAKLESFSRSNGLKVIDIKDAGIEDVYDLTVEDNHNFYIITNDSDDFKSGILVHNCCLSGDTLISTIEYGNISIKEIVTEKNGSATVFDGENWIKINSFKQFKKSYLYRIKLKNGSHIDITWNHRNKLQNQKIPVMTIDLKIGDILSYSPTVPIKTEDDKKDFTIVDITRLKFPRETFCCTVPTTSYFELSNGVLTGNSEITLYTDSKHSFVCCLSSLNLDKYDEWRQQLTPNLKLTIPYLSTIFLDAVLSEFIDKASKIPELYKAVNSAIKGRALGQ